MGRLWVGVMPNQHSNLIGLSKYARLADWIMSRPQIQEEAITQMAELLMEMVKPDGLAIVMEADHFCMHWRGVKDTGIEDGQQRDARLVSEGCSAAARVPVDHQSQELRLPMLVRCLYASRAVEPLATNSLDRILEKSRRNNLPRGITGLLCYSNGIFVQVLEGGRGAGQRAARYALHRQPAHSAATADVRGDRRAPLRQLDDGQGQYRYG